MDEEICKLPPDESWLIQEVRKAKQEGFGDMEIKIHAGVVETITVTQKHRRVSGLRVVLKD